VLIDTKLAHEFLYNYQMIMTYLNHGEIPDGKDGFAALRTEIYICLDEIDEAMADVVGAEFISNLKNAVYGDFIYLEKNKNGYVFKHIDSGVFYQALALTTPLEDMIKEFVVIQTALIPFHEYLVCDGLVIATNITLGKTIVKDIREEYCNVERESGSIQLKL